MKIVVIGGTGLIGSKVVSNLRQQGHEVVAGSPSTGINTLTGEGLAEAMENTDVVIDLSNSPSFEDKAVLHFFETSGKNLLAAELNAGVKHHIALSIVGADLMQGSGYMRAKVAQEELAKQSGIPYTIIRSTQFYEFLAGIAYTTSQGAEVHLSDVAFQPIAAEDVANFVTQFSLETPKNDIVEIAGPDRSTLSGMVAHYLQNSGDDRTVVANKRDEYFGAQHVGTALVPQGEANIGSIGFQQWLQGQLQTA